MGAENTSRELNERINSDQTKRELTGKVAKYAFVSATVLAVWELGGKQTVDDLIDTAGNLLSDAAKNFMGLLQGIGDDLLKVADATINSGTKIFLYVIAAVAAVVVVAVSGYFIYKHEENKKNKK